MMLVKVKGIINKEKREKFIADIKKQISEGLIIYDDTIEITFADDMCVNCGANDLESITTRSVEGDIFSHVMKCNRCGHLKELVE